jgi:hypothetical protein
MRIQNTSPVFHKAGYLDDVVWLYGRDNPRYYSQFTDGRTTNNYFDKIASVGDMPTASVVDEGDPVDFADFQTPFQMDVYPRIRGLASAISKLAWSADPYGVMAQRGNMILDGVRRAMEYDGADFLNLATLQWAAGPTPMTGSSAPQVPDGQALASAVHPLANGTATNIITNNPPLSYSALQIAKAQMMRQLTHEGNPWEYDGELILLVPPELEDLAMRLTTAVGLPGTNNNDRNWAGRKIRVVTSPYFTSPTAWALVAAKSGKNPLVLLTRDGATLDMDEEKIRLGRVLIGHAVWAKYARDWRNFFYSAGS